MMLLTWVTLGSAKDWLWRILKADKVETAIRYERIIAKEAKMKARSKISIGGQSPRSLASLLLMVFILLTLNGCSGYRTHITLADEKLAVTGRPSAVPVEFLDEFPSENYEVLGKVYADALGVLHVSPDTSTVDELITKKAGSIGADAVVHMHYGIAPYFVGTKWLSWGSGLAIRYVDQKPKSNLLDFVVIIRKPEKTGLKEGWEAAKPEEVTWEFAKKLNSVQYKLEAHGYYAVIESSEESSYLDLRQLGSNYLEFLSVAKKIHHKTYISESDAKKLAPGKEVRYVGEPVYLLSWSHELVDSSQTSLWSSSEGFKSLKPIFDLQDRKNTKLDPMVRE